MEISYSEQASDDDTLGRKKPLVEPGLSDWLTVMLDWELRGGERYQNTH